VVATPRAAEGASLQASAGYAGLQVDAELAVRGAVRMGDPAVYHAATAGVGLRASVLGIVANDHRLERYLDLGFDAGGEIGVVPGVPPRGAFLGGGWYGAWVDVGTLPVGDDGYVAVTTGFRVEAFDGGWFDRTQLLVGLAWRKRRPVTADELRWRD
jgi:hypothetical protein